MRTKHAWWCFALMLLVLVLPDLALAQGLPLVTVNSGKSGQQYSMTLQLLGLMTVLTVLPSLLLMMTSFVRIIIVLSILRQALGTGQTPPNTVLVGLALFLTLFIMSPVFDEVYTNCLLYTSPSPRDRTRSRMPSSA